MIQFPRMFVTLKCGPKESVLFSVVLESIHCKARSFSKTVCSLMADVFFVDSLLKKADLYP